MFKLNQCKSDGCYVDIITYAINEDFSRKSIEKINKIAVYIHIISLKQL